jgi:hypothetical protein
VVFLFYFIIYVGFLGFEVFWGGRGRGGPGCYTFKEGKCMEMRGGRWDVIYMDGCKDEMGELTSQRHTP